MKKNDNISKHFKRIYTDKVFQIGACDGTRIIASAEDIFKKGIYLNGISLSSNSSKTKLVKIDCFQLIKKVDSMAVFSSFCKDVKNPKEMMFTQHQAINICEKYFLNSSNLLSKGIFSIPFENNNEYFIADVEVSASGLDVYVYSFEYITAWHAVNRRHLVVPII